MAEDDGPDATLPHSHAGTPRHADHTAERAFGELTDTVSGIIYSTVLEEHGNNFSNVRSFIEKLAVVQPDTLVSLDGEREDDPAAAYDVLRSLISCRLRSTRCLFIGSDRRNPVSIMSALDAMVQRGEDGERVGWSLHANVLKLDLTSSKFSAVLIVGVCDVLCLI